VNDVATPIDLDERYFILLKEFMVVSQGITIEEIRNSLILLMKWSKGHLRWF